MPEGDLNTPPSWMNAFQKAAWIYALENSPQGLLRRLDRDLFITWCSAQAEFTQAEQELLKTGPIVKLGGGVRTTTNKEGVVTKTTRSDSWIISPWAKLRDSAFVRLMKATSELGFSPTSRARISLGDKEAKKDQNRFSGHKKKK